METAPAPDSSDYRLIETHVPPVIHVVDGRIVVDVIHAGTTIRATIGDGRYFLSRVVDVLINPLLKDAQR